jgi:FkbM family methyltransferase
MISDRIIEGVRRILRRGFRLVLRAPGTGPLRRVAVRLPFSRFHILVSRLFWGSEVITWRGIRVEINPGDVMGYYAYFLGDYATEEINKCIELCHSARTFADVGANVGLISLSVARVCPKLTVFAFEPDRQIAARLRRNLALNQDLGDRVHVVEAAVAGQEGTMLFVPTNDPTNAEVGRLADEHSDTNGYPVHVVTLSRFFAQQEVYPEVVKIDVEGAELQVLRGMHNAPRQPDAILMETHGFYFGPQADDFNREVIVELDAMGCSLLRLHSGMWQELRGPGELGARSHLLALRTP